jgi:tetratricopeptide (TPR) repeat protein
MIGISSRSAGVLLLPKPGTDEYSVLDVIVGKEQDPVEAKYRYSAVQDWEEIEGTDGTALLKTAIQEYWLARTVSLLREVIGGLESSLEKRVLEHVEEILGSRVSSGEALDCLLIAPLADPRSPLAPAKSALSYGFSAVASILDELVELQPLLRRLTDLWLSLPETPFSHLSETREMIWVTMVEKGAMKQLLKAGSRRDFTAQWNLLMFSFPTPRSRSGVSKLGRELSHRLFPSEGREEIITGDLTKEAEPRPRDQQERVVSVREAFSRVEKQIAAIAQAVSEGRDAKADKFLRELIREQTSFSDGVSYAVKSLCNIAKQCADMFRSDFEVICLDEALRLLPSDPWTLIQYGDYLKRVGNYDKALEIFGQAEQFGENDVAKSSVADVYSQQGDYAKAIDSYETIPNWNDKPAVRTAIADNLRKMGRMDESEAAYTELIRLAQQGLPEFVSSEVRARAGIAEIAKRQGKLEDALEAYYEIMARGDFEDRDKLFYKLGLCNVLKLMEKFDDACAVVDEVIQQYPFAMEARFIRGSILGLIGHAIEGLRDLPESSSSRSWREWLRRYYRGLLLFKLERYEDAKKNLVEELPKAIASGEEKAILRMAAAVWFLGKDEIFEADGILSQIPDLHDCHARYLSLVLKLHSTTRKEDLARVKSLREQIAEIRIVDERLDKAVVALDERNFSLALAYETDALLKLAA